MTLDQIDTRLSSIRAVLRHVEAIEERASVARIFCRRGEGRDEAALEVETKSSAAKKEKDGSRGR